MPLAWPTWAGPETPFLERHLVQDGSQPELCSPGLALALASESLLGVQVPRLMTNNGWTQVGQSMSVRGSAAPEI